MSTKQLPKKLLKMAKKAGASACEVYLVRSDGLDMKLSQGELQGISRATTSGVGLRILAGQRLAFIASSDLSEATLGALVERGVALAREAEPNPALSFPSISSSVPDRKIFDPEISEVTFEQKEEFLRRAEAAALARDPRIRKAEEVSWHDGMTEVTVANSGGGIASFNASLFSYGLEVVAEKGGLLQTGGFFCPRRFSADLLDPEEVGRRAADEALLVLGGKPVPSAKVPVIFRGEGPGAAFLRWGIGRAVLGDEVRLGRSFLDGQLDGPIASSSVTVLDDGRKPKGLCSAPFDGEGTRTQRNQLISEGVLKMLVYDSTSGARAGVKSTGNAVRGWYGEQPKPGFTNLYMSPGSLSREQLLAGTAEGFYCVRTLGFGIDAATGGYSMAAQGRWIRGGELAEPVAGITLVGRIPEMLQRIDAVGSDLTFDGFGWDESVNAPSFRISEMTISGT